MITMTKRQDRSGGHDLGVSSSSLARGPVPLSDLVIGLVFLLIFAAALVDTVHWRFQTALFPRIVTTTGVAMALLFLATTLRTATRGHVEVADTHDATSGQKLVDEDDQHDHEVEYIFASAGPAVWASALGWVAFFVVLIYFGGLFVASGIFAAGYLRWSARRSYLFALTYAAVMTGLLYLAFDVILHTPVPESIFQ